MFVTRRLFPESAAIQHRHGIVEGLDFIDAVIEHATGVGKVWPLK